MMAEADPDFAEVERRSQEWMNAWMAQDRALLEPLMTDDYALIVSTVPEFRLERDNWLRTAIGPYRCTRFAYDGIQMRRVAHNIVVMSAIADFDATIDGIDRSGRYFVTDLWRLEDGGWKVCVRYSSRPGEVDESVRAVIAGR